MQELMLELCWFLATTKEPVHFNLVIAAKLGVMPKEIDEAFNLLNA